MRVAALEAQGTNTGKPFSHREFALVTALNYERNFKISTIYYLAAILTGEKTLITDAGDNLIISLNPEMNRFRAKQQAVMEQAMDVVWNIDPEAEYG